MLRLSFVVYLISALVLVSCSSSDALPDGSRDVTSPYESPEATLAIPDGNVDSQFGWSIAIDGETLIIGALRANGAQTESGAAYVYEKGDSDWELVDVLIASDSRTEHLFGYAVDIDGDQAIVSAYGDDHYGDLSGAAYIFERGAAGWTEVAKLLASDGEAYDRLGGDVSISDGVAILGATGDDDNGLDAGAAYLFAESGGTWEQVAKLTSSDGAADDRFGSGVALDGQLAVITKPGTPRFGPVYGAAYVFEPVAGSWAQTDKLTPFDAKPRDSFGYSVDVADQTVIVGAPFRNTLQDTPGAVYLFERENGAFTGVSKVTAGEALPGDSFGLEVAASGDYLLVKSGEGPTKRAVHVLRRTEMAWVEATKLESPDEYATSLFGSITLDGNYMAVSIPNAPGLDAVFVYPR